MKTLIIGGGLGGLALAALLRREGFDVYLFEKNENTGGRANFLIENGYFFDTGPSWFLMDDIFDIYFSFFNKNFYKEFNIVRLDPIFKIYYEDKASIAFRANYFDNENVLESLEKGSFKKFKKYIDQMERIYYLVRDKFILREISLFNFFDIQLLSLVRTIHPFENLDKFLRKNFKNEKIIKALEFNSLFLGTNPKKIPAILSMINFFIFKKGVFYINGGIYELVKKLNELNYELGTKIFTKMEVIEIKVNKNGVAEGIVLKDGTYFKGDLVISNADLYHTETTLIKESKYRSYDKNYWQKVSLAPSALIIFLGLNKKVDNISHHNFYFCNDWNLNFKQIFNYNDLPSNPSFYVSSPSQIDDSVAPKNKDLFFILVPVSSGLKLSNDQITNFKKMIYEKIEEKFDIPNFKEIIEIERFFLPDDFINKYNSFSGTALGPLHDLRQTLFRPKNKSKNIKNLYYVGSYVNPGIGMPMVIASAMVTYNKIIKDLMIK